MNSEKWKMASLHYAKANAYCQYFKDTLKEEIFATARNEVAEQFGRAAKKCTESQLERLGRVNMKYKEASQLYKECLETREYLRLYIRGLEMEHEAEIAQAYRVNSEIKAGIYSTGS
jgi:hypothetical protein